MKKLLLLFAFAPMAIHTLRAQEAFVKHPKPELTIDRSYYQIKSENWRSAGWLLFGFGAGLAFAGSTLYATTRNSDDATGPDAGRITTYVGAGLIVASIPAFIISGNYAQKAVSASVGFKISHGAPGLALKVRF